MTLTVLLAGGNLSSLLLLHTIFGVAPIFLAAAVPIGGLKVTVILTSSPVTGPSPPVNGNGGGPAWIPFTTEFMAVKTGFTTAGLKLRLPALLFLVAELISMSAGEFIRVRTGIVRVLVESMGENAL